MDIGYELPELLEIINTTVQPQFCHICGSFVRLVLIFDDLPASRHEDEDEGESRGLSGLLNSMILFPKVQG